MMATSVNVCELYATSPLGFWAACRSSWPQSPPAPNSVFFSSVRRSPAGSCCFCLGFLYLCVERTLLVFPGRINFQAQHPVSCVAGSRFPPMALSFGAVFQRGFVFRCSVPTHRSSSRLSFTATAYFACPRVDCCRSSVFLPCLGLICVVFDAHQVFDKMLVNQY
jgi:hypothetical protein